jgi:hypothetical protein
MMVLGQDGGVFAMTVLVLSTDDDRNAPDWLWLDLLLLYPQHWKWRLVPNWEAVTDGDAAGYCPTWW